MNNFENLKRAKILITGHTGFKGAWLSRILRQIGSRVIGLSHSKTNFILPSLLNNKLENEYLADIHDGDIISEIMKVEKPDLVFHLAAQSLVGKSQDQPSETIKTNVLGTANVLFACMHAGVKNVINVTTDKVYHNTGQRTPFIEDDQLGGEDIYSASKASVEIISNAIYQTFSREFPTKLANVRAGNVVGGGDFSENRLIPDIYRSVRSGAELKIRNLDAVRPWQHVLEPISGYMLVGDKMLADKINGFSAWNFGPNHDSFQSVSAVVSEMSNYLKFQSVSVKNEFNEASFLTLDSTKARTQLGWENKWDFETTIQATANWYKALLNNDAIEEITEKQINAYFGW